MSAESSPAYVLPSRVEEVAPGIHLREWTDADPPSLIELFDEIEMARWTPLASPFDAEAARAFLADVRRTRAEQRAIQLAVTVDGGRPCGAVMLFIGDETGCDRAELAYGIGAGHRGLGLAAKSVRLMTEYAYHSVGVPEVVLRIPADNVASIGVARATGFVRTDAPPVVRDRRGLELTLDLWVHRPAEPER
ncbi:GNAT family N-acetyltransferase [Embleya hyalina]|uniref:Acetyltransferase n=1 Tax=Embleya hyalina TaxID=516124 RepID=A0A401Z3H3_9ACTN|nr:GNAT family N-acetyltransferase [Embleya hyalina]GCE01414.1 acetyltransferase [Embleya hyalina]